MDELLSNPRALVAIVCLGGILIGLNLSLFGLLRNNRAVTEEMAKWGKALRGGSEGRRKQEAQLDELHRRVAELKAKNPDRTADE